MVRGFDVRGFDPFGVWRLNRDITALGLEAGAIVAMRTMGMMGLWKVGKSEALDMFTEKPAIFAEAWMQGVSAALKGAAPDRVLAASIKPLGRKTRSNHARLMNIGICR